MFNVSQVTMRVEFSVVVTTRRAGYSADSGPEPRRGRVAPHELQQDTLLPGPGPGRRLAQSRWPPAGPGHESMRRLPFLVVIIIVLVPSTFYLVGGMAEACEVSHVHHLSYYLI